MAIDRRLLIQAGAGMALVVALPAGLAAADDRRPLLYAAARRGADGRYSAGVFDERGREVGAVSLPGRGHDLATCPVTGVCVAFARRPGTFAVAFGVHGGMRSVLFKAPADRHFYGHGVFSRDGRLLFATENDFEAGRGAIGVYEAGAGFRRVGELSSYGIGPHDIVLSHGGEVLVVANGGGREHPDFGGGRRVLNAEALEASLVYIDARSGDLLERHDLGRGRPISLRHLAVGRDDTVVVGAQLGRGAEAGTPLVFTHKRQGGLVALGLGDDVTRRLAGYVSSVDVEASGEVAAITSSRGGIAVLIELASGRVCGIIELADVSGVAAGAEAGRFVLTTGRGVIAAGGRGMEGAVAAVGTAWQWDNHAIRIGV